MPSIQTCTIGGTRHQIISGSTVIGSTKYSITTSTDYNQASPVKIVRGGTAYPIFFPPRDIASIFVGATCISANRCASSTGQVSVSLATAKTYYVFSICYGYCGIYKVVSDGSTLTKSTLVASASTSYANIYTTGTTCYYSNNGTSAASRYAVNLYAFSFDSGLDESVIDSILQQYSCTRLAGRNSSSKSTVSFTYNSLHLIGEGNCWIVCSEGNTYFAMSTGDDGSVFGEIALYQSGSASNVKLHTTGSTAYYSTDGTTNTTIYGGSVIVFKISS